MLAVEDPSASAEYYRERLGFNVKGVWGNHYAIVERNGFQIHLNQHGKTNDAGDSFRGGAYMNVQDVRSIHEEVKERGARPLSEPQETDYGMREFAVMDLDGWILSFGQPIS